MRKRMICALVVAIVGLSRSASATDSDAERATLTGLPSLSVVVEELAPVAEKSGLSVAALQSDVERRLKQAGLSMTADADAYLYVHVTVGDPGGAFSLPYVIEVALMQEVTLPRGLKTRTPIQCQTWWVNTLGLVGPDRLRTTVNERVAAFVEQFVRAYRSVNPKA